MAHSRLSTFKAFKTVGLCLGLLPLGLLGSPASSQDWASFRGPTGDGRAQVKGAAEGLTVSWSTPIGSGYSGISVHGQWAVTAAASKGVDQLVALDTSTGEERWAVTLGPAYIGHGGSRDGVVPTPAIAEGSVYGFSPRGNFVAIELDTGKVLWRRDLAAEETEEIYYGFASSPVVYQDLVIVQLGGKAGAVIALERANGNIAWRSYADSVDSQTAKIMRVGGRDQVVVASNSWVAGLDPKEGALLWRWAYSAGSAFVLSTSPLPLPDGRIFFTPGDDRAVVLELPRSAGPAAPDAVPEPTVVWEANVLTSTYSPATRVGDALVGYTSRFLGAYSVADGERLWRSRAPGDGFLIALGEQLVVITKAGGLHLADIDDQGYSERASEKLFEDIVWTPPTYSDGALYVRSMTEIARVDLTYASASDLEAGVEITERTATDERSRPVRGTTAVPSVLSELVVDPNTAADRIALFLRTHRTPIIDGTSTLFLWQGEANDVGIASDFLGLRMEAPFRRLAGTDLWWYQTEVDPRMQYSYLLYIDYQATVDPLNPRREKNTVWGTNANWVRRGQPLPETSYFAMPDWVGEAAHLRPGAAPPNTPGTVVQLQLDVAQSAGEEYRARFERPVDVWLPPGYDTGDDRYPTVYLHEWVGARSPDVGRWLDTLDRAVGQEFAPLIVVFLDRPIPRGTTMAPLVAAVDAQLRTIDSPSARASFAMAFRSVEALVAATQDPGLIGKFAVQSFLGFEEEVDAALSAIVADTGDAGEVRSEAGSLVGYFEWGLLDVRSPSEGWDMREYARQAYERLEKAGVDLAGGPVVGTTDWKSWRHRTHLILKRLFPVLAD